MCELDILLCIHIYDDICSYEMRKYEELIICNEVKRVAEIPISNTNEDLLQGNEQHCNYSNKKNKYG